MILNNNNSQGVFLFSLTWSVAGVVDLDGRRKFSSFLIKMQHGDDYEHPLDKEVGKIEVPYPDDKVVHDFMWTMSGRGKWSVWTDLVKGTDIAVDRAANIQSVIVPTMDTARTNYFVELCTNNKRPMLYVGPTGTGLLLNIICETLLIFKLKKKFPPPMDALLFPGRLRPGKRIASIGRRTQN